jgi:hypothetical protein
VTCQVVVLARGKGATPPEDPAARAKWDARALELLAPLERTVRANWPALRDDDDCTAFFTITHHVTATGREEGYKFKAERFRPAATDPLDPVFMEHLTSQEEPGVLAPFSTRFGVHLVVVPEIIEPHLEEGSLPPAELAAARAREAREGLHPSWRASAFEAALERMREDRVVRLVDETP